MDPSYFPLRILHSAQGCWPGSLFTCFQIQGGKVNIKQTCALLMWLKDAIRSGGGVVPLRLVCLSLALMCRPVTSHSNLQSRPNPKAAASLELAPRLGLYVFFFCVCVGPLLRVVFMQVSLFFWNTSFDQSYLLANRKKIRDLFWFWGKRISPMVVGFLLLYPLQLLFWELSSYLLVSKSWSSNTSYSFFSDLAL